MAQAQTRLGGISAWERTVYRNIETGVANTTLTSTTPAIGIGTQRIVQVTVAYSAAPTQTGVTVTLGSGAGASYNCVLFTGAANGQFSFYQPTDDLMLGPDDTLIVTAPAGGVGITAAVTVYVEKQ